MKISAKVRRDVATKALANQPREGRQKKLERVVEAARNGASSEGNTKTLTPFGRVWQAFEAKAAQACDQLLRVTNEEGGLPAGLQVPAELQDLVWPLRSAQSAVVRYEASRPRGEALRNVLVKDGGNQAKADRLEAKIARGAGLINSDVH